MTEHNSSSVDRSIRHWVRALSAFGREMHEISVPSGAVIKLTEEFFDAPESPSSQAADWFRVNGTHFEVYLDDDTSSIRLANRRIMLELLGSPGYPLVTWFGHRAEDYELVLKRKEDDVSPAPGEPQLDPTRLVWVGWAHAHWRTYLFDGTDLFPVTDATGGTLDPRDERKIVWMGWDGDRLDVFTAGFEQLPRDVVAIFVGTDGSIIAVRPRKTGR